MSHRIHQAAAAVTLTALTTAQAFALTLVGIPAPNVPRFEVCYVRVYTWGSGGLVSATFPRICASGEKPGAVTSSYQG